ncbi:hypothetical protein [Flagellimonas pacifica]|uniref:Uncharacterized protein n=1 Tax=Flagellimonas pacifica TaxID=1247520 RepID=A0A285MDV8_9FLAO|nr:hypothetical protein [Allomuricauda parva]SNY95350.1 hypothetical protein SAMN06265377_1018 [Allomuricauda parva]
MKSFLLATFALASFGFSTSPKKSTNALKTLDCEQVIEWGTWSGNGCGSRINKVLNYGDECGANFYVWEFATCDKKMPKDPGHPF